MTKKIIVVSSGEPAGVGPELCLRLPELQISLPEHLRIVVLADYSLMVERAKALRANVVLRHFAPDVPEDRCALDIVHCPLAVPSIAGHVDVRNAPYVLSLLDHAVAGCLHGDYAAMVTAPVHKGVINQAGIAFTGHTEYLAEKTATPQVVMMLAGGGLRVALATTHLALKDVPAAITAELLTTRLRILHRDMHLKYGIAVPRILVTGLNPHAGEGGYLGREEIDIITPVLDALRHEGLCVLGPFPADTLFTPPILKQGDCVFAMYHDQGLTALKYASFGQGINVTLGLPIIRTSVDHGTALELAGTGSADVGSLFEAVQQASLMSSRQVNAQQGNASSNTL